MEEDLLQANSMETPIEKARNFKLPIFILCIIAFVGLFYYFFLSAPASFVPGTVFTIEPGMSLHKISLGLKEKNIIRSRIAFETAVILLGGEKHIKFSDYLFDEKMSLYRVALWIVKGERYRAPVVVTIPEGYDKNQIADAFSPKLINFDRSNFLAEAKEGYLFPDTYYFFSSDDEASVINSMTKNFEKKVAPVRPEILTSGKTENQIITMASILEREAKGDDDRGIISGILWKRVSLGMRLEVDAAPETYKQSGLPKSPISNPGLQAIHAAIYPENSPYLYYLHDKDGITHFAKTFAEHRKNIAKYLK